MSVTLLTCTDAIGDIGGRTGDIALGVLDNGVDEDEDVAMDDVRDSDKGRGIGLKDIGEGGSDWRAQ